MSSHTDQPGISVGDHVVTKIDGVQYLARVTAINGDLYTCVVGRHVDQRRADELRQVDEVLR